jgi:hypothetical protein
MQSAADRLVDGYEITSLGLIRIRETHELTPTRMLQVDWPRVARGGPRPEGLGLRGARKELPRRTAVRRQIRDGARYLIEERHGRELNATRSTFSASALSSAAMTRNCEDVPTSPSRSLSITRWSVTRLSSVRVPSSLSTQ